VENQRKRTDERKRQRSKGGIHSTTGHQPHVTSLWPAPTQTASPVPMLLQKVRVTAVVEAATSLIVKEMPSSHPQATAAASSQPAATASILPPPRKPDLASCAGIVAAAFGPRARLEEAPRPCEGRL
jgi:hypothetical protein